MSFPRPAELLPHAGAMLLIDEILEHDASSTLCGVEVPEGGLFATDAGHQPVWISLEYMAQCAAAHGGLEARREGGEPAVGFLIGSRLLRFHTPSLAPGTRLGVRAHYLGGRRGLVAFGCEVRERERGLACAEAELRIYMREAGELG